MANGRNGKKGDFGGYVIMGAGIALGFVTVSVLVTGVSMLASEGLKMVKAAKPTALPTNGAVGGMLPGQTTAPTAAQQAASQRTYY